ncbi:MAG: hypothetical protein HDR02_07965 [Lachnospiraceae bacterium]|nr:hypothetical protein [Lachnospiraceae bacterium]
MEQRTRKIYHIIWVLFPYLSLAVWGALCVTNNLWYDEAYTAALISHPLRELVQITSQDVHAPFYYILLKGFYTLCGGQAHYWSLKLFSLLMMFAYMLMGKYGVKKLYDEQTSVYFMLFSVLMPSMCVQAGNARMYAMGLFFFTATGLLACDILRQSTGKKWILFCLCSIGSVYSHTFSMIETLILYLILLGALLYRKKYALLKWYLGSGIVVAACYMAWLLVVYRQMQSRIASAGANEELFVPNMYTLMDYCKEWFSAMDTPIMSVIYLGIALTLFLGYHAVDRMRDSKCYIPGWGMGILGLTALTGGLLSYYVTPCFLGRYIFPGFGALALWYAVGMRQIVSPKVKAVVLAVFLLCFVPQYRSELELEYDRGLQEYEAFYESNVGPADMIMATDIHPLLLSVYHPQRQYMAYGYLPPFSPFQNTTVFTQWEQLEDVTGDIWLYGFADRDMPDFSPYYNLEPAFQFHYMYYDFAIYRLVPAQPIG